MNSPTTQPAISSNELQGLLDSPRRPRIIDVRTPGEFETAHIPGSVNVPLDVLGKHAAAVADSLADGDDVVLVCRSGQRSFQAQEKLRGEGLQSGRVLERGLIDWETQGFDVDRGVERWDLERQVRLVAGGVVLTSVLASIALPRLKWLAAAIGTGLTYSAVSNTCPMAVGLAKLPYNRGSAQDPQQILSTLKGEGAQRP